jgi:hypothetical protein
MKKLTVFVCLWACLGCSSDNNGAQTSTATEGTTTEGETTEGETTEGETTEGETTEGETTEGETTEGETTEGETTEGETTEGETTEGTTTEGETTEGETTEGETTEGETTEGVTTEGGTGSLPPCEEYDPNGNGTATWNWNCALSKPCGTAHLIVGGGFGDTTGGGPSEDKWNNPEAAQCVIEAFKAGKPAKLWLKKGDEIGQFVQGHIIDILDSIRGVEVNYVFTDSPDGAGIKRRQILKSPEYFDGCAAKQSDAEMYTCLTQWSKGCLDDPDICPE